VRYFPDFILLLLRKCIVPLRAQGNATVTNTMTIAINCGVNGQYHIFSEEKFSQSQTHTVTENLKLMILWDQGEGKDLELNRKLKNEASY